MDVPAEGLVGRAAPDQHRAHPRAAGALDVLPDAVADHHGVAGRHPQQAQRGLENARMRLQVAVL